MRPRKKDRHLPPCVYLKHGKHWLVKGGKWSDLGADLATALAEYGRRMGSAKGSMPELIEAVFQRVKPGLADETVKGYRRAANTLKRKLANFSPEQVKSRHVAAIRRSLEDTPNEANRTISFLRTVFKHAVEDELVDGNPCVGVDRLKEGKRKRYISDDEFRAIYAQAGPRLRVIMDLQYLTAQRINDVLTMRRSEISDAGILLRPQKTENSSGVRMTLKWSPQLRDAVERAKRLHGNVHALTLLHGRTGKAPDYRTVALQWKKAADAADVADARPNDIRAKALTDAKRQGKNAQALAGHASEQMTQRYIRQRETPEVEGPSFRHLIDADQKAQ